MATNDDRSMRSPPFTRLRPRTGVRRSQPQKRAHLLRPVGGDERRTTHSATRVNQDGLLIARGRGGGSREKEPTEPKWQHPNQWPADTNNRRHRSYHPSQAQPQAACGHSADLHLCMLRATAAIPTPPITNHRGKPDAAVPGSKSISKRDVPGAPVVRGAPERLQSQRS